MDDWKFFKMLEVFSEHEDWCEPSEKMDQYFNEPGQLWFSYPWTFEDPLEGTFPNANEDPAAYCDRMAASQGLSDHEATRRKEKFLAADTDTLRRGLFGMAQACGVSCWHASSVESMGMWRFVFEQNGVAIRSTCEKVEHALATAHNSPGKLAKPSVCAVGYVDHASYFLPEDGFRNLLGIIREAYSYENEVRFVAKSPLLAKIPTTVQQSIPDDPRELAVFINGLKGFSKDEYISEIAAKCEAAHAKIRADDLKGFNLPIRLNGLIDEVVLKSGCDSGYANDVRKQMEAVRLNGVSIVHSTL